MYLQNVVSAGQTIHQELLVTIALCHHLLGDAGAVRVHGGGFGGAVQAFVPLNTVDSFQSRLEKVLGRDTCHVVRIRPVGGIQIV